MAMLSPLDIRRILRNNKNDMPVDDVRIIDSWTEYEDGSDKNLRPLKYLCYEMDVINPSTGEQTHIFKALKFCRITRLPRSAKESLSLMDMQTQVLSAVWEQKINLTTVIANIIEPEPLGLLYLYGVQGVGKTIEEAKRIADSDYVGLCALLQGTYRVLHFQAVIAREAEWLREKMDGMNYMSVVRGIPKANRTGEDGGNKGIGNTNVNPDSQGTIEEIVAGMVDYEYVIQILSSPVYMDTLRAWQTRTQQDMTMWNGQLQGTKAISASVSLPMMYMANASSSQGWSHAYTQAEGVSLTEGESFTSSIGQSIGESLSHSFGESLGKSSSVSVSESVSESNSVSNGSTIGSSVGQSFGETTGVSQSVSSGQNQSVSESVNESVGTNESFGTNHSTGTNQSVSDTVTDGNTHTEGTSHGEGSALTRTKTNGDTVTHTDTTNDSYGQSRQSQDTFGESDNHAHSENYQEGFNSGLNTNFGFNVFGLDIGTGQNMTWTESKGDSFTDGHTDSLSHSEGRGYNINHSDGFSDATAKSSSLALGSSLSFNDTSSVSDSVSHSTSHGVTNGVSESFGDSHSVGSSHSIGSSTGHTVGSSQSVSDGKNFSQNSSINASNSISDSETTSRGTTIGKSVGQTEGSSYSQSVTTGSSKSKTDSETVSEGTSTSKGTSTTKSLSDGTSGTFSHGSSGSMGIAPSLGYNKSYQWLDQQVKDILELLEFQNERIKYALRGGGAFYTYVYIACPTMDALSAAQALAKSTWQNEFAMTQPVQVLDLTEEEQKHLLYHFYAFSSDVTRTNIAGASEYKYTTVLLPKEFVSYTHLPRISEGGIYAEVNDVPKFASPSMLSGEIYMGSIISSERYSYYSGYVTKRDYRVSEQELMHGFFTGASRSGKTVAAMRFVSELTRVRRSKTGKRLRIVCMDPKRDWRALAHYVEPERFRFYSMGNPNFHPLHFNPCKIPKGVIPQIWIDVMIEIYCRAYGLLERGKQLMAETFYSLYEETGVFDVYGSPGWEEKVPALSANVTFEKAYHRMNLYKKQMEDGTSSKGRGGNDTRDAYARLLERLSAFGRPFSIERRLFGGSDGLGIDELIGNDDVTVLESKGLESTFRSFIFGVITAGFYRYAIAQEGGFLAPDQYETVLIIEEANEVLTGSDTAGNSNSQMGLSGQSEFEQILDQSAGYGLFIFAITQKIADMPKSVIANSGLKFAGKIITEDDINVLVKSIGRDPRYDDRDVAKWFPRSPTGWFVCQSSRTKTFMDAEPVLVKIAMLPVSAPTDQELEELLTLRDAREVIETAQLNIAVS